MVQAHVYGDERELPDGFDEFTRLERTAVVSIDMHHGHLDDSPDCPCPAPRAREIVEPVDRFHDAARTLSVPSSMFGPCCDATCRRRAGWSIGVEAHGPAVRR